MNKLTMAFNPPTGTLDASLWFWRCQAEMAVAYADKQLAEAEAMRFEAMQTKRRADKEVEAMGRTIANLQKRLTEYEGAK